MSPLSLALQGVGFGVSAMASHGLMEEVTVQTSPPMYSPSPQVSWGHAHDRPVVLKKRRSKRDEILFLHV